MSRSKRVSNYRAIHRGSVEEQFNRKVYKEARSIRLVVEELSRTQKDCQSIHLAVERCRDCDKKQLKSSIDKPGVERCRDCLKTVFQEGKNIDMNAIKTRNSTKDPTTF